MRVLVSAAWIGGAGGAERALHSILRALDADRVDVVVRERLGGPYAEVGSNVRVSSLFDWRWRWANMHSGAKGALVQRIVNPVRRRALPHYDVYLQFFSGADLNDTVRAEVRLLIPSGNEVSGDRAARFDAIAMQAPDNVRFVPEGARAVLLPPPVYDVAQRVEPPTVSLPDQFLLTVFNPYGDVKGTDDLAGVVDAAPYPLVWCHSQATVQHLIPSNLAQHRRIVHAEDATPAQLRYLYEHCAGYVSLSRTEGFGWGLADALRYAPAVFSRRIGVMSFPEVADLPGCVCRDDLDFDWTPATTPGTGRPGPAGTGRPGPDLSFISPDRFRGRLQEMVRDAAGTRSLLAHAGPAGR